jgi:hypothetical protein
MSSFEAFQQEEKPRNHKIAKCLFFKNFGGFMTAILLSIMKILAPRKIIILHTLFSPISLTPTLNHSPCNRRMDLLIFRNNPGQMSPLNYPASFGSYIKKMRDISIATQLSNTQFKDATPLNIFKQRSKFFRFCSPQ